MHLERCYTTARTMNEIEQTDAPRDFIRDQIRDDLASGRVTAVVTRFPT
jgi:hypothetical protein